MGHATDLSLLSLGSTQILSTESHIPSIFRVEFGVSSLECKATVMQNLKLASSYPRHPPLAMGLGGWAAGAGLGDTCAWDGARGTRAGRRRPIRARAVPGSDSTTGHIRATSGLAIAHAYGAGFLMCVSPCTQSHIIPTSIVQNCRNILASF